MHEDMVLSETFRRQAGSWRLAPFVTALIILIITAAAAVMSGVPSKHTVARGTEIVGP